MQLKQRVKKEKSSHSRRTMKRMQKQRGGANFVAIPDASRRAEWATALAADMSWANMYDTLVGDTRTEPAVTAGIDVAVTHYVTAVMRQDELLDIAVKLMRAKLGIAADEADILTRVRDIETRKAEMMEYILDVQRLVSFVPTEAGAVDVNQSKIGALLNMSSESLASLILYPARATNIFVQALATLAIQLKADANAPMRSAIMDEPSIQRVQADHFKAYADSLAFLKTARPLRDGFFMDQPITSFTKIIANSTDATGEKGDFWIKFVSKLRTMIETPDNAEIETILGTTGVCADINIPLGATGGVSYDALSNQWADVTSAIVASYVKGGAWSTLDFLKTLKKDGCPEPATPKYAPDYVPNPAMFVGKIAGTDDLTLGMLFQQFNSYVVHFILQLAYMIEKMEPSVTSLVEPPMAAASTP